MIDKKGRVFGKINIIDLMVVLIIACIIFVIAFKIFGNEMKEDSSKTEGTVTLTLSMLNVVSEARDYINVGDRIIKFNNMSDTSSFEVVSVRFEKTKNVNVTDSGMVVLGDSELYSNVYVEIKSQGKKDDDGIMVGGVYVFVNQTVDLNTTSFTGTGRIIGLSFEKLER